MFVKPHLQGKYREFGLIQSLGEHRSSRKRYRIRTYSEFFTQFPACENRELENRHQGITPPSNRPEQACLQAGRVAAMWDLGSDQRRRAA